MESIPYTYNRLLLMGVAPHYLHEQNLSKLDLSTQILRGLDLRGFTIAGANFESADLSGADLRGIDFVQTNCVGTIFSGADLRGTSLALGYFHNADFTGADLRGAILEKGLCNECQFAGADLRGARFGAEHYDSDLRGCDLRGAHFLPDSDFKKLNCDIRGASLTPHRIQRISNKRVQGREKLVHPLPVFSGNDQSPIGLIHDIHSQGFRLRSPTAYKQGTLHVLTIQTGSTKDQFIRVTAKAAWNKQYGTKNEYDNGFQIEKVSEPDLAKINKLVSENKKKAFEFTN